MNVLPNYNEIFAAGLGTVWATEWEVAPPYLGRDLFNPPSALKVPSFFHLQIRLKGEIYLPPAQITPYLNAPDKSDPPVIPGLDQTLPQAAMDSPVDMVTSRAGFARGTSSILKIQLQWKDAAKGKRCLDLDLGAGVDVIIGPCSNVYASLLLPVAGSERATPPGFPELGFASAVDIRVDCVESTAERSPATIRWTDTRYLERNAGVDRVVIPRRKTANRLQASVDVGPFNVIVPVWDRNPPPVPEDIDPFGRVPLGAIPPRTALNTEIDDIPGYANAFQYDLPVALDAQTLTVVQELNF